MCSCFVFFLLKKNIYHKENTQGKERNRRKGQVCIMERKDPVTGFDNFNFDSMVITLMVAALICWDWRPLQQRV